MSREKIREQSEPKQATARPAATSEPPPEAQGVLEGPVGRRAFLAGTSVAAAGAAYAAFGTAGHEEEETGNQEASDPRRLTYRETDHIRRFYARARF